MNIDNESQPTPPGRKPDMLQTGTIMFLAAQLKAHRDMLVLLLKASNLQPDGKLPEKYLEDKIAEQANELLRGLADHDPRMASFFATFLQQKKDS
jgi:hypothetical protein